MAPYRKARHRLVIVRSGQPATFEWLCRRYGGKAIIIEDRRERQRRQHSPDRPPEAERRRGVDRRHAPTPLEEHRWRHVGYRIVDRAGA